MHKESERLMPKKKIDTELPMKNGGRYMSLTKKVDLRNTDWRDAIVDIAEAVEKTPLTNRAMALLIADTCKGVSMSQVQKVLEAIPKLSVRYLK